MAPPGGNDPANGFDKAELEQPRGKWPHALQGDTLHESRDPVADIWGPRMPYKGEWPQRVDERIVEEPEKWIRSACVLCSNGCGMDVGVKDGKIVGVRGLATDRVNKGRLGPKGMLGWETNHHPDRLTHPMIRKNGKLERASWDEAMSLIVKKTKEVQHTLSSHGIGFYTSGQLFLEEYFTLATIGKAGLGTLHMDGNTRLCTATAAAAMRESFGCDGQPGSYTDIDVTDCIFMVGHNMSATQTVLWSRVLDRLADKERRPKLIVMDPRRTATAKEADVHIAPKIGTNVAVLNGIQALMFEAGHVNEDFIAKHTVGGDKLREIVKEYTPEKVEEISGVPADTLRAAAKILGETPTLLSTALQGVYQSNQATSAACQVNNINLLKGAIGKPGSGIFQMNGQPTAQNNRESGCNGEYPGFRNPNNQAHVKEMADFWNIKVNQVPHWALPTAIMDMLSYIDRGTITMFWVSGTNPAVSLPELERVRRLFTKPGLFLVVQDIFMTETAQLADVVLPAAMWSEKTGCFTNVDRTVHIAHKAVEPPGEARSDLEIFCDYAARMEFKDKDGNPLVHWKTSEEAFKAWAKFTVDRPCDYTGMTYEKLSRGTGIQWPCNEKYPNGKERLYDDRHFMTEFEVAESYGHDLDTGTPLTAAQYKNIDPRGRAFLKHAHYIPPLEEVCEEYPFALTTGRNVYHFHTRSKTGRARRLQEAAPEAVAEMNEMDAKRMGLKHGDYVQVSTRRGAVEVLLKVEPGKVDIGTVFIPFHYGSFDNTDGRARSANDLTLSHWDPISKQPVFKGGAAKIEKTNFKRDEGGEVKIHARERQSEAIARREDAKGQEDKKASDEDRHLHIGDIIGLFNSMNDFLIDVYETISEKHIMDMETLQGLKIMRRLAQVAQEKMKSTAVTKYGNNQDVAQPDAERMFNALFPENSMGSRFGKTAFDVMMDLHALFIFATGIKANCISLTPASAALHDEEFIDIVTEVTDLTERQLNWLQHKISDKSPQTLIVPAHKQDERVGL